jgi:hypothetical protein
MVEMLIGLIAGLCMGFIVATMFYWKWSEIKTEGKEDG